MIRAELIDLRADRCGVSVRGWLHAVTYLSSKLGRRVARNDAAILATRLAPLAVASAVINEAAQRHASERRVPGTRRHLLLRAVVLLRNLLLAIMLVLRSVRFLLEFLFSLFKFRGPALIEIQRVGGL